MSERRRSAVLLGGPSDGAFVAETFGNDPALLLSGPRPLALLDRPDRVLVWNERLRWYAD